MDRRDFMKQTALGSVGVAMAHSQVISANAAAFPKRPLGNTGVNLSIIGFGGIVVTNTEQEHANRVVAEAVERGINYFDVAPSYGNAEEKLGPALKPFRDDVFLACKTQIRDREGARKELESSLKNMQTDRFDLYQLHALSKMEDLDEASGKGGALEAFVEAREKGLIQYIGFSAHSAEVALAAMDRFDFNTILFPFNFVAWHEGDFGPQVLAKASEKGVARLALKAMAYTRREGERNDPYTKCWYVPVSEREMVEKALRFTLSLDITAAIPPGEEELFTLALDVAQGHKPLSDQEQAEVKELAAGVKPIFQVS